MSHIVLVYLDIDTGYYPGVNHGIASLASSVKHRNHSFSLIHLTNEVKKNQFVQCINKLNPDVIGFSFTTP
jgi:hypothetical protein